MRRLKWLLLSVAALLIIAALAGCGGGGNGNGSDDSRGNVSDGNVSDNGGVVEDDGSDVSVSEDDGSDVSVSDDGGDVSVSDDDGDVSVSDDGGGGSGITKVSRGAWTGNTFTNETTGVTFHAPESLTILSDEQIAEVFGVGMDMMLEAGAEINQDLAQSLTVYDMLVTDLQTNDNMQIMLQNLTIFGFATSADDVLEETMKQIIDANAYPIEFGPIKDATLGGQAYRMLKATPWGVPSYSKYICAR
jgi:hypothetical protein